MTKKIRGIVENNTEDVEDYIYGVKHRLLLNHRDELTGQYNPIRADLNKAFHLCSTANDQSKSNLVTAVKYADAAKQILTFDEIADQLSYDYGSIMHTCDIYDRATHKMPHVSKLKIEAEQELWGTLAYTMHYTEHRSVDTPFEIYNRVTGKHIKVPKGKPDFWYLQHAARLPLVHDPHLLLVLRYQLLDSIERHIDIRPASPQSRVFNGMMCYYAVRIMETRSHIKYYPHILNVVTYLVDKYHIDMELVLRTADDKDKVNGYTVADECLAAVARKILYRYHKYMTPYERKVYRIMGMSWSEYRHYVAINRFNGTHTNALVILNDMMEHPSEGWLLIEGKDLMNKLWHISANTQSFAARQRYARMMSKIGNKVTFYLWNNKRRNMYFVNVRLLKEAIAYKMRSIKGRQHKLAHQARSKQTRYELATNSKQILTNIKHSLQDSILSKGAK